VVRIALSVRAFSFCEGPCSYREIDAYLPINFQPTEYRPPPALSAHLPSSPLRAARSCSRQARLDPAIRPPVSSPALGDTMARVIDARGSPRAILRAYNWFAPFYGAWSSLLEQKPITRGLALANVQSGERVLEVAVGTGAATTKLCELAGPQCVVTGVDIAPRMLSVARRRAPNAELVRADARALPFAANCFHLLWSSYFLDLISNAELPSILREFRRVLRPGGRIVLVSLGAKKGKRTWWERLYQRTPSFLVPYLYGGCRPIHMEPLVGDAGFAGIVSEMVSQGLVSEIVFARKPF
jgi:ubiquinone/menaquinone biosynthesis C-methylase UbiE